MTELAQQDVIMALSKIRVGDTGSNVVASGMIQGLVVKNGHVGFALEVKPEEAKASEPLRKACEEAVYAVPGVLSVTAALTAHSDEPSPAPQPQPAQGRPSQSGKAPPSPKEIPGIKDIIAVASGKGGVGKSTIAVNLALGLVAEGKKVGLLDADIYGPSIPRMLGLKGKPDSDGKKIFPMEAYGLKTMSIGFLVDEDTPMIWRGPMVMSALRQMMLDVQWGELDVLVVDMPPGTGDAQLTLVQNVPLKGAVMVSTPQDIALIDVRKGIAMFEKVGVPILGMVENMSYFESPGSGERSYIFGEGGAKRTAETLGKKFLGEVPIHIPIRETSDEGKPLTATQPESEPAKIFQRIASEVAALLN